MPCRFCRPLRAVAVQVFCMVLNITMWAQNGAGPQPVPMASAVPAPVDQPYAGTISLSVDLTNVNDRVLDVREAIPVKPGKFTPTSLGTASFFIPRDISRAGFNFPPN